LNHADLHQAILLRTNLSDAQLQHCNLSEARLNRAYLSNANLQNANLHRADLSGAYVLYANFSGVSLQEAALIRAYLSNTNLDGADLSNADLNGTNLTSVALDNTIVDGAVFEANLGLSERQKSDLHERGASIMPLPLGSSPLFPNHEELKDLPPFREAQGDLTYRFLDWEEALEAFHEVINILKQECEVPQLEAEYERIKQEAADDQRTLLNQLAKTANGDISEWLLWEFPQELDHLHRQICRLTYLTYSVHHCWIDRLEQSSAIDPNDEEF
jgi:Pentapeptide repeats (8 copies)